MIFIIQHIEIESPGLFSSILQALDLDFRIIRVDLNEQLPFFEECTGLIVLGGPMGVGDISSKTYPWLKSELDFIKNVVDSSIPFIGVCLGAQLLAYAMGGGVRPLLFDSIPKAEIGWDSINPINSSSINRNFKDFPQSLHVLHWHSDQIILPEKAELLASSVRCREQMFKVREFAIGLQFHLEVTKEMVDELISNDLEFINNSLGPQGGSLLRRQNYQFANQTLPIREGLLSELIQSFFR